MPLKTLFALTVLLSLSSPSQSTAQPVGTPQPTTAAQVNTQWLAENYTKQEVMIPMRDGVELFTSIYTPKAAGSHPIIMKRTPYSCRPYGEAFPSRLGPSPEFALDSYIVVHQDVRGCWMSEGEFVNMTPHVPRKTSPSHIDESTDCYDTIEWLINNVENNNGNVGLWGISYPGFYATSSMINHHPALKASSPQAPIADWWYDDFHHHGAFFLPHTFGFISRFGLPRPEPTTTRPGRSFEFGTPDGYDFYLNKIGPLKTAEEKFLKGEVEFWTQAAAHPNRDEFWQKRDILPHLYNVAPAVLTVGGWFDAEDLYGPLNIYRSIEAKNPGIFNVLVMGPWVHGGWARSAGDRIGNAHFGGPTSPWYRDMIQKPFFDFYLRGIGDDADGDGEIDLAEAIVFETGANRWQTFDQWPPANTRERNLYLHDNGALRFDERPVGTMTRAAEAHDAFISDPNKPVPLTQEIALGMPRAYMTDDQRFASRRPDVLTYQTEALDEAMTLAGPLTAELWVSTDQADADWVVKLIDVHPDDHEDYPEIADGHRTAGYEMMVRSEVIRGRFRNDPEHPEPFVANQPTLVRLPLQDVLHTFKPGHKIMIQIQSTWFPLVDRNPQSWVDNIFSDADEEDFVKATHRVYRSPQHPTRIVIGVLN